MIEELKTKTNGLKKAEFLYNQYYYMAARRESFQSFRENKNFSSFSIRRSFQPLNSYNNSYYSQEQLQLLCMNICITMDGYTEDQGLYLMCRNVNPHRGHPIKLLKEILAIPINLNLQFYELGVFPFFICTLKLCIIYLNFSLLLAFFQILFLLLSTKNTYTFHDTLINVCHYLIFSSLQFNSLKILKFLNIPSQLQMNSQNNSTSILWHTVFQPLRKQILWYKTNLLIRLLYQHLSRAGRFSILSISCSSFYGYSSFQ
ncbi:unnamed protein product (macronuclear) [Paramecium tetraurelia]|uniref:Transmembrane protein n=1 Tax=Paramecium tetraurelia TaxID=5888 RepID=A0BRH7_PARTE|nr:uncharacterized protein GSPATT00031375001 [Paramecium tetraurelia]CAK61144.1 unnamed protein product [Paramecium tetraurelia]|eukprot:XP_001428542.1 hypothetical protein (macronuclear) [Paramecium tetraurelia strain d4-2]